MSRAQEVADMIVAQFPGVRVTSTDRTRAEQDALIAKGVTSARNSQHLSGNGIDIALAGDTTPALVRRFLSSKGIQPGEFMSESGKGEGQGTGAHLHIGLQPKGGDPASSGTTYDKVTAARDANASPSIAATYQAYKSGKMDPQDAAQFEQAVIDGHIVLPRGGKINKTPPVPVLPKAVVDAFNSGEMENDPDSRAELMRAVQAGEVALPRGMRLQAPAPRSVMENINLGLNAINKGLTSAKDIFAGGINGLVNEVAGTKLSATPFKDAEQLPGMTEPRNDRERMVAAGISSAAMALPTLPFTGGAGGAALDLLSGATSGIAQETARQAGAGPVGQTVAGLMGGLAPIGIAGAAERVAARGARNLPDVVAETPRAAVIDESGNLTPHGQEVAARHNATPEEVHAAYEAPPDIQRGVANDATQPAVAREATTNTPTEPIAAPPEAVAPVAPPAEPVIATTAKQAASAIPQPDSSPAAARVAAAAEQGIDMTRGQATKNFDVQDAEQRLKNSNGAEGEAMRQFVAKQQEQVTAAVDKFQNAIGEKAAPDIRGTQVREALSELRDLGQKGVSELYKQARELGAPVDLDVTKIRNSFEGLMAEADIPESVKKVMEQEAARYGLIGKPVAVDKATGGVTNEANVTTVKLDDGQTIKFRGEPQTLRLDNAEDLRKVISKQYPVDGPSKLTQELKRVIDDTVEETAAKLAEGGKGKISEAMAAARKAHVEQKTAFGNKDIVQDIIDWKSNSSTAKLSPETVLQRALGKESDLKRIKAALLTKPTVKSEAAWRGIQAHGLAQLFEKATTRTTNAVGEITEAISGAKLRSAIAGFPPSKLRTLLDKDDFDKLMKLQRVIEDVTIPITGTVNHSGSGNLLMRIMNDADNKVTAAFGAAGFAVAGPVGGAIGGTIGRSIAPAIKASREAKSAAETLSNATEYTATKAATDTGEKAPGMAAKATVAVKRGAAKTVREFIDIYSNPAVLAPVVATAGGEDQ